MYLVSSACDTDINHNQQSDVHSRDDQDEAEIVSPSKRALSNFSQLQNNANGQLITDGTRANSAKKLIIKNFKQIPRLPDNFRAETWLKLKQAIWAIQHSCRTQHSREELYQAVLNTCKHGSALQLYVDLKASIVDYVKERVLTILDSGEICTNCEHFLTTVCDFWNEYCQQIILIRSIFLYLDRTYVLQNNAISSILNMSLDIYRDHVVTAASLQSKILHGLLELIGRERAGETVDRGLLRTLLRMLTHLQIYQSVFEERFLEVTDRLYAQESQRMLQEMEVADYLTHVQRRLDEENTRLLNYLNSSTQRALLAHVERQMIAVHVHTILHKGLDQMLSQRCMPQLKLLFSLLSRVKDGLGELCSAMCAYVKKHGRTIVMDEDRDRHMVQDLLDFKQSMDTIIADCFCNNDKYSQSLRDSFESFINMRPNKPAELAAKFLDTKMRAGNKEATESEMEVIMDRLMVLFRFIHGKDVFEAFYKKDLAKRLLLGKSASVDAEKLMLNKLKQECGSAFTCKLEGMFKDMELSRDLMQAFKSRATTSSSSSSTNKSADPCTSGDAFPVSGGGSIDLCVNVLTTGYWPTYHSVRIQIPSYMLAEQQVFQTFYLSKHSGRKLQWQTTLGHCLLRADFISGAKELHVSLFQTIVLLLFNEATEHSLEEIQAATELESSELERTLQSLACGKARVIKKCPRGRDICPGDRFVFNSEFRHPLYRIKINQIQLKETTEEHRDTEQRVFQDRQYQIDAAIVRVMKMRKSLSHSLLLSELYQQLRSMFQVKPTVLKKRIESLIDRDYMERDKSNPNTYNYVA